MATLLETHAGEWTPADLDLLPDHWKVELLEVMVDLASARFGPDVAVAHRGRIDRSAKELEAATFALVVEVASPSTAAIDRTINSERYAAAGIPAYWRVELDPITVIAYSLRDGAYAELGSWGAGETVEVEEPLRVSFDPAVLLP